MFGARNARRDAFDAGRRRLPPRHSDSELLEIETLELGHLLVRSLVPLHRSLIRLPRTARFARARSAALICSLARSLTRFQAHGTVESSYFQSVLNHCARLGSQLLGR